MQKFFAIGNLTRDPDLSQNNSSVSVCRFTIAVNRPYVDGSGERQADFFNCIAWRGLAESIARYCVKGNKVAVTGSIQMRTYEDNKGVKQTTVDIIVQDVEFLIQREKRDDFYEETPRERARSTPPRKQQMSVYDDDGDIPF